LMDIVGCAAVFLLYFQRRKIDNTKSDDTSDTNNISVRAPRV
jgi:hypothetical protein